MAVGSGHVIATGCLRGVQAVRSGGTLRSVPKATSGGSQSLPVLRESGATTA